MRTPRNQMIREMLTKEAKPAIDELKKYAAGMSEAGGEWITKTYTDFTYAGLFYTLGLEGARQYIGEVALWHVQRGCPKF